MSSKKIFHANNLRIFDKRIESSYPYVVRMTSNNGVRGYIIENEKFLNKGNTLSFAQDTFSVFYQKKPYFTGNKVKVLKFKENFNERNIFFVVSSFQKLLKNYSWGIGSTTEQIKEFKIKLPTKNGEIDFDFMEEFISELEEIKLKRVKRYLKDNNLDNFELNKQEKEALEKFENNLVEWGEFRIGDLFEIKTPKKKFDANKVKVFEKGKYPYVVRTSVNNGIRGYLNEDEKFLNEGNTLSFGQDTATIFYQPISYFTGDKIKILKSKFNSFNKIQAMFYLVGIRKSFSVFSWGSSSFNVKVISNQTIKLPIKNGEIDFDFMENLVKAIQKKIIKKLIKRYNLAGKSI